MTVSRARPAGPFRLVFFASPDGRVPVEEFLKDLEDPRHETKIVSWLRQLVEKNLSLREPYVKSLGEGIWELRVRHGRFWYRVLYFYHGGGEIVLTNAFRKVTAKTPPEELEEARRAKRTYEANPRRRSEGGRG